ALQVSLGQAGGFAGILLVALFGLFRIQCLGDFPEVLFVEQGRVIIEGLGIEQQACPIGSVVHRAQFRDGPLLDQLLQMRDSALGRRRRDGRLRGGLGGGGIQFGVGCRRGCLSDGGRLGDGGRARTQDGQGHNGQDGAAMDTHEVLSSSVVIKSCECCSVSDAQSGTARSAWVWMPCRRIFSHRALRLMPKAAAVSWRRQPLSSNAWMMRVRSVCSSGDTEGGASWMATRLSDVN